MKTKAHIIGGGTAALLLAAHLDSSKFSITIHEKNKKLGRKFLVAGDGGFNLTHSEDITPFIDRYTPKHFLADAIRSFSNVDFIDWLHDLGIPTFIGSSKRVYPEKGIKPVEVLQKIEAQLLKNGVNMEFESEFTGFAEGQVTINRKPLKEGIVIFALGGGSWKVTGSTGAWLSHFTDENISTKPFEAANCAFAINWKNDFLIHEGKPLKNIAVSIGNKSQKGEAVITSFGIEGNAIYALSPEIQDYLKRNQNPTIHIDLKPSLELKEIENRLKLSAKSIGEKLKTKLKLDSTQRALLKQTLTKEDYLNTSSLAAAIKALPLTITAPGPIDRAISTAGGIDLTAVDSNYQLKNKPHHYCIGEMLDWNAPTGGYLIQGCVSMSVKLAKHLNNSF